jgi:hypothetical protein
VDKGVLPLLSPQVHYQFLCFVDIEGDVIFLVYLNTLLYSLCWQ